MARKTSGAAVIASLDDLHRRLPELVRLQETHPRLALAALANPLLALEHAGYAIAAEIAREVELRTRFRGQEADELLAREKRLKAALGSKVDLDDPKSYARPMLSAVAAKPVKASRAAQAKCADDENPEDALKRALEKAPPPRRPAIGQTDDPLAPFANRHPLIADFVAYRRLEASRPRLADRALFEELLAGRREGPVSKARFIYKSAPKRAARRQKKGG